MDANSISGAGAVLRTDVSEAEGFFEKNPKATAIGSAIAGALLLLAAQWVIHFI